MPNSFNDIEFLFPNKESFDTSKLEQLKPEPPFSEETIAYLSALSVELNKDPNTKLYPDVATFAFFCRKANLYTLKKKHVNENSVRLGRGIVFHIAPSNVPVNFAYSLLAGLLSGNVNIVRIPSKNYDQVKIICKAIQTIGEDVRFKPFSNRIVLVKYDRSSTATALFSSLCDARVIWGGDETIHQVRQNRIPPRAFDMTFSDRYSICAINANEYIKEEKPQNVAVAFFNDTYLFDQNACTSPHLIIWLGKKGNIENAKKVFWENLYKIVKRNYQLQPSSAVNKLLSFYSQSIEMDGVKKEESEDNLLWRVELKNLSKEIQKFRCNSGYFSEYSATSILEITNIIDQKYQTLSYYGFDRNELVEFITKNKLKGIDRVVPIGKTSDFSLLWDGYELISSLSRICEIN